MISCAKCDDEDTPRDLSELEEVTTVREDRRMKGTSKEKKASEIVPAKQASISKFKSRGKGILDEGTNQLSDSHLCEDPGGLAHLRNWKQLIWLKHSSVSLEKQVSGSWRTLKHSLKTEINVWKAVERFDGGHICFRKIVLVAVERMN